MSVRVLQSLTPYDSKEGSTLSLPGTLIRKGDTSKRENLKKKETSRKGEGYGAGKKLDAFWGEGRD